MSLLAVGGPAQAIERSVDLARRDEIVLVQSFDFLGAQGDGHVTPAEADVGVMAFGLGEFTDFLNKSECFPEIAKSKGPLDAVGIVTQLPIGSLCLEALGFITRERRDAAAPGRGARLATPRAPDARDRRQRDRRTFQFHVTDTPLVTPPASRRV